MVESGSSHEQYANMAPHDLNQELYKICDMLPERTPGVRRVGLRTFFEALRRREKSELKSILLEKLRTLIDFSPTTKSFHNIIINEFDNTFDLGVQKGPRDLEGIVLFPRLYILIDRSSLNIGGIFEPSRAKELELATYKMDLSIYLSLREQRLGRENDTQRLGQWRREFIELYGDEP